MTQRILLVEDDRTLRETLGEALRDEGFDVTVAADGDRGADLVFSRHFDAVVLDWMLPGRSGIEILRELRAAELAVPVMLLTVRSDEDDKVEGFELGADDYVTKPFGLRELLARLRALLRRSGGRATERRLPTRFRVGGVEVDLSSYRVLAEDGELSLSPKEAAMLRLLLEEEGCVVSRNQFLDVVWGDDAAVTHRTIDTHVLHLRQKIETDAKSPVHLLTVHGVGYRLVLDVDAS